MPFTLKKKQHNLIYTLHIYIIFGLFILIFTIYFIYISGLGLVLLNSGNIDAAIDTYDSLIGNRPNTLAAYFMRGVAYSRKGLKVNV